ncbi:MAG TPA: TolC family protein [Planctomycetota bacterium]|nr:TolC family protein [Planctomycetota bacterium]
MSQSRCCIVALVLSAVTAVALIGCASPMSTDPTVQYEGLRAVSPSVPEPPAPTPGEPPPQDITDNAPLADYLYLAMKNNPGLEASFNRWKAELERMPQVTSLSDPRFTYRYYIREVETRVGPQEHAFGVSQTFPWFGKLSLRGDVALEAANAARERYEAEKLKLFYRVKDAYYEHYHLRRASEIVAQNLELAKYFERIARTKFKVATGKHADVIRAQVEIGKLDDRLSSLRDLRSPIVARLNAALNRPLSAPLPWPAGIPEQTLATSDDDILAMLEARSPELKALEHEIEKQRRAVALARKEGTPDVTLSLDYIVTDSAVMPGVSDSGKDPVMAGVSLNLPIWAEKYRASEREARRRLWAAIQTRADRTNVLGFRVKEVLYEFRDAERRISLYRDTLLPQARESVKVTETAYAAGTSDFLDLIDSQRVMLDFQLAFERALADHAQRLAEIEMLVGQSLSQPRPAPAETPKPEEPAVKETGAETEKEETKPEEGEKGEPDTGKPEVKPEPE